MSWMQANESAPLEGTSSLNGSLVASSLRHADRLARRRSSLQARLDRLSARVSKHQAWRLTTGALFAVGLVIAASRPEWRLSAPLTLAFLVVFGWLLIRTRRLSRHRDLMGRLLVFLERQEHRARGQASGRSSESASAIASREFPSLDAARDLGVFGPVSLWTLLDETMTEDGERELLSWLSTDSRLSASQIRARQELVKSLRPEAWFYTRLTLVAEAEEFRASTGEIQKLLKAPLVDDGFMKGFIGSLILWAAFIGSVVWMSIHGNGPVVWTFLAFALFHLGFLMQGGSAFGRAVGLTHHLEMLGPVFEAIEHRTENSLRLREQCPVTFESGPARQARRLGRILGFLGVQTNPILHILLNSILPWSSTATHLLLRARRDLSRTFPQSLKELARLEAISSLVIFDRHQTSHYPEVLEPGEAGAPATFETKRVFHPLVDRTKVVANDFSFPRGKHLGLLTGSNMSGKSTFLRTIGLNQILANAGAPVFAESYRTRPLKIETCIEVSDSLRDGFSYFYSEVRRIRHLLETAKREDGVLFLIDEIFRGTNNRERHVGSRAVIRTLARASGAQGFISTHDLELAPLETTEPALANFHFREEIQGRDMRFPYLLHPGPCPTTNALKIMEMEGIDLTLTEA